MMFNQSRAQSVDSSGDSQELMESGMSDIMSCSDDGFSDSSDVC